MPSQATKVHTRYRNKAGVVVPGVTTVIALLAKPALINWAWRLGLEGQDMNKVRDKAADIGTCVHYLAECHLKGQKPEVQDFTPDTIEKAKPLVRAFAAWAAKECLRVKASEANVVSEAWQFGGCIDIIARRLDGKLGLYDIKTSKGIYDEYKIQLAAYEVAWDEVNPDSPIEFITVIHLDKETNDLHLYNFGDLSVYFEIFKHLRAIYMLQKTADPKRRQDPKMQPKGAQDG